MSQILTRDEILKVAKLARLAIPPAEVDSYIKDLSEVIEYVKQLDSVDTGNLDATNQVTGLRNVFRDDQIIDYGYTSQDLLSSLNQCTDSYIKVKRVIE